LNLRYHGWRPVWHQCERGVTPAVVAVRGLALLPRWSPNVVEKIQAKAAADAKPSISLQHDRSRS